MAYTSVEGIDLYYETAGSGWPVVLVNSHGTTLRTWDEVIADLSADHHVVAYDWRGCGRSERTAHGNTIEQNARDLLGLIADLSLVQPVLVGSSVGGLFACQAALIGNGSVGGVVTVGFAGHLGTVKAEILRTHLEALRGDRAAAVAASAANMYSPRASDELRAWTTRQVLDASPHTDALYDEQTRCDPRPWLPHLEVPVRYVHGALDAAVPLGTARELAAITPGADLVVINDAGHLAQQEDPAGVAEAIRSFIGLSLKTADSANTTQSRGALT